MTHQLTAEPLTIAPPEIGTPAGGQIHVLAAEPLQTKPPEIGTPAMGQIHVLCAESLQTNAPSKRRRRAYLVDLCRTILRERVWPEGFPTRDELPHGKYLEKAKGALKSDPRSRDLPVLRMRKTIMRAGYRER